MNNSAIWETLEAVKDPEIPVLSIVDLGVLREVNLSDEVLEIVITPTYSGCPAMKMIENEIIELLQEKGYPKVRVRLTLSPAWTTDWMKEDAKERLREYGIAPPEKTSKDKSVLFFEGAKKVNCPLCKSGNTYLESQFGSTACKSLYFCKDCQEPFDHFKCI